MALTPPVRLRVDDPSGVAPARRAAEALAAQQGFDESGRSEVAIVVTELATNLVRHAGGGEVVIRATPGRDRSVDAIAWDHGPGIANLQQARGDGFSTAGGAGTGLGAIGRLSTSLDLQAPPGHGVVIAARVGSAAPPPLVDGLALALAGQDACGDAWTAVCEGDVVTVLLADGLGHGPDAAAASAAATREVHAGAGPGAGAGAEALMRRAHAAMGSTRGAAAAIARVDLADGSVEFTGVGNVAATIVSGADTKSMASMPGTLGHRVERFRTFTHVLPVGGVLVLHSDGLRNGWSLADSPGLARRDPLVIAAALIRDWERGSDDVSVVALRRDAERAA
jgi:anti-sigma regulatory factor (Ser/Thr protein kinase)